MKPEDDELFDWLKRKKKEKKKTPAFIANIICFMPCAVKMTWVIPAALAVEEHILQDQDL